MTGAATDHELDPRLVLDPEVLDQPYDFYARLRELAPVWRLPGTSLVVVSSFAGVSDAVRRTTDFSSNLRALPYRGERGTPETTPFDAGPTADVLATADPPTHTLHRSTVFPELVARRMAALRDEIEQLADLRIDGALAGGPVEFMHDVANAVPIRVISRLIGFDDEDPDDLLDAAFASTGVLAATQSLEETFEKMARAAEIMGWITEQLDRATAHGADGILGLLGTAVASGDLPRDAGVVILHTLLSAGGESTTSLLGHAVHLLARTPDLQDALRSEPGLIVPFTEEVLRLETPFRYHMRHAPADTELCGVEIPAGSTVLLFWGAANRDPAEHDHPDEIRLDRPAPRHHLGFGRGIHLCVGAPLARLEAEVVLGRFLARTSAFALDPDDPPEHERSLVVRRFARLPLLVDPSDAADRQPSAVMPLGGDGPGHGDHADLRGRAVTRTPTDAIRSYGCRGR